MEPPAAITPAPPADPVPPLSVPPSGKRRRLLLITAVCLLVLGIGGWYGWRWYTTPVPPEIPADVQDPAVAEALAQARQEVLAEPRSGPAWGRLGMIFHAYHFMPQALECYAQAEHWDALDCRWPYYQGLVQQQDKPAAAADHWRQAVALAGEHAVEVRLALADLLVEMGHPAPAQANYQEVLQEQPANRSAHFGLGKLALQRGDWLGCLPFLLRAADGPEHRKTAHRLLAMAYMRTGQLNAASRAQFRARRLEDDTGRLDPLRAEIEKQAQGQQARFAVCHQLYQQGAYPQFLQLERELAADYPDDPWIESAIIRGLLATHDLEGAGQATQAALKKWPRLAPLHFSQGRVYFARASQQVARHGGAAAAQGDYQAAATSFERVTQLKPDNAVAFYYLALCHMHLKQLRQAEAALRTALGLQPEYADAHATLAELLIGQGEDAEALVHIRYALALSLSDDQAPSLMLAWVLSRGALWK